MVTIGSSAWWSNLLTFLLLSVGLGVMGIDRFYKGEILWPILKLISAGGFGIWYIVDICIHAYRLGKTGQWTKDEFYTAAG
jgi:TM2 domain-containing membrane protein YozV